MQEVFEKIKQKLEELRKAELDRKDYIDENGMYNDCEEAFEDGESQGRYQAYAKMINFVNQVEEEYNKASVEGDLISRSALLEELRKTEEVYDNNLMIPSWGMAVQHVKNQASIQNDGWIPCSERLPEEYKEVLVCDEWGGFIVGSLSTDTTSNTGYVAETGTVIMYDCIAWQPLPKPYEKEV